MNSAEFSRMQNGLPPVLVRSLVRTRRTYLRSRCHGFTCEMIPFAGPHAPTPPHPTPPRPRSLNDLPRATRVPTCTPISDGHNETATSFNGLSSHPTAIPAPPPPPSTDDRITREIRSSINVCFTLYRTGALHPGPGPASCHPRPIRSPRTRLASCELPYPVHPLALAAPPRPVGGERHVGSLQTTCLARRSHHHSLQDLLDSRPDAIAPSAELLACRSKRQIGPVNPVVC